MEELPNYVIFNVISSNGDNYYDGATEACEHAYHLAHCYGWADLYLERFRQWRDEDGLQNERIDTHLVERFVED